MTELDAHAGTTRHRARRRSAYTLPERRAQEAAVLELAASRPGITVAELRKALPAVPPSRMYQLADALTRRGRLAWGLGPKGHTKHYRVAS